MEAIERKPTLDEIADGKYKVIFDGIEYDNIDFTVKNGVKVFTLEKRVTEDELSSDRYKMIYKE